MRRAESGAPPSEGVLRRSRWVSALVWLVLAGSLFGLAQSADPPPDPETVEATRQHVRANPSDLVGRRALAECYERLGNCEAARVEWEAYLRLSGPGPDSLRAAYRHGVALVNCGRRLRATRALEDLARRPEAPVPALRLLADLLEADGFPERAALLDLRAAAAAAGDSSSLREAAARWKRLARHDEVYTLYRRLCQSGGSAEDEFQLGLAAHRLGLSREARDAYEVALARDPRHAEAAYNLALVLKSDGDPEPAVGLLQRVIDLRPHYEPVYFELGTLLLDQGRVDEADAVFARFEAISSDSAAVQEARFLRKFLRGEWKPEPVSAETAALRDSLGKLFEMSSPPDDSASAPPAGASAPGVR